jgi:hypothetical protein
MVQFKRDLPLPGDREPDNTYWTIGGTAAQTELTRSSYRDYRPRPLTGKDLVAYNDGKERGLVYYGACTTKELWGFIRARGIIVGPKGNVRKPGLIATLEQADEDVKFTRFFNLRGPRCLAPAPSPAAVASCFERSPQRSIAALPPAVHFHVRVRHELPHPRHPARKTPAAAENRRPQRHRRLDESHAQHGLHQHQTLPSASVEAGTRCR